MLSILFILMLPGDGQKTLRPAIPFEDVTDDADGQWITVSLMVNTAEDLLDGKTFYGCESSDGVSRSVCFRRIVDLDERFSHVIAGKLRVLHHPPMFAEDIVFEGFTEYRLECAIMVK